MGNDRESNGSQQDNCEIGSFVDADLSKENTKKMVASKGNSKEESRPQGAQDAARSRLMEISQAVPPDDDVVGRDEGGGAAAEQQQKRKVSSSSSPRAADTDDEFRIKLMSISYSEIDQPIVNAPQPRQPGAS